MYEIPTMKGRAEFWREQKTNNRSGTKVSKKIYLANYKKTVKLPRKCHHIKYANKPGPSIDDGSNNLIACCSIGHSFDNTLHFTYPSSIK